MIPLCNYLEEKLSKVADFRVLIGMITLMALFTMIGSALILMAQMERSPVTWIFCGSCLLFLIIAVSAHIVAVRRKRSKTHLRIQVLQNKKIRLDPPPFANSGIHKLDLPPEYLNETIYRHVRIGKKLARLYVRLFIHARLPVTEEAVNELFGKLPKYIAPLPAPVLDWMLTMAERALNEAPIAEICTTIPLGDHFIEVLNEALENIQLDLSPLIVEDYSFQFEYLQY